MKLATGIAILLSLIINNAVFAADEFDRKSFNRQKLVYGKAKGRTEPIACAWAEQKALHKMGEKLAKKAQVLRDAEVVSCDCVESYDDNKEKDVYRCTSTVKYYLRTFLPVGSDESDPTVTNDTLD